MPKARRHSMLPVVRLEPMKPETVLEH